MYPYQNNLPMVPEYSHEANGNDRFFPLFFPFLTGALIGGVAVGATRPRPVYVNPSPYYGSVTPPGYGYNYSSYGYYPYR